MQYVVLRYRERPDEVVDVTCTSDPGEAVDLARRWSRYAPEEGLIVAVDGRPFVHCAPRGR